MDFCCLLVGSPSGVAVLVFYVPLFSLFLFLFYYRPLFSLFLFVVFVVLFFNLFSIIYFKSSLGRELTGSSYLLALTTRPDPNARPRTCSLWFSFNNSLCFHFRQSLYVCCVYFNL